VHGRRSEAVAGGSASAKFDQGGAAPAPGSGEMGKAAEEKAARDVLGWKDSIA
jgi:hypothetical protein